MAILSLIAALSLSVFAVSCGDAGDTSNSENNNGGQVNPTPDPTTPTDPSEPVSPPVTDVSLESLYFSKNDNPNLARNIFSEINENAKEITIALELEKSANYYSEIKKLKFRFRTKPENAELYLNGKKVSAKGSSSKTTDETFDFSVNADEKDGNPTIEVKSGEVSKVYTVNVSQITEATQYTITYETNNEEYPNRKINPTKFTKEEGGILTTPNSNEFKGYEFTGWNTSKDGTGTLYAAGFNSGEKLPSEDLTLYAQWKEAETVLNVTAYFFQVGADNLAYFHDCKLPFTTGTTPTLDEIKTKWGTQTVEKTKSGTAFDKIDVKLSDAQYTVLTPGTEIPYITYQEDGQTKTLTTQTIPKIKGNGTTRLVLWVTNMEFLKNLREPAEVYFGHGTGNVVTYTIKKPE